MLAYLDTSTGPDLAFVVVQLNRFVDHPNTEHFETLKRAFRYPAGTLCDVITYARKKFDIMQDDMKNIAMKNSAIATELMTPTNARAQQVTYHN